MHTHEANIPSQALTAMVFPVFRSGTIFSDVILWVLFLLITDDVVHDIFLAAVVHERDGIFFQVRDYIRGGGERERERARDFKEIDWPIGSCNYGSWQVQSLYSRLETQGGVSIVDQDHRQSDGTIPLSC